MKVSTTWQGKMRFDATAGDNTSLMDAPAPFGDGSALSPKQLLLASICGCTGVDVAARMRKHKQGVESLRIDADAPKREGKPSTFDSVTLDYFFDGEVNETIVVEAVVASQTEDCGVSAMVAAHCPIFYRVHVNGKLVHEGQ
ncbi:MAG: OsmC family protein, partial [Bdellovibrionota bacterium]